MFADKQPPIGIDIGSSYIKIVQLKETKKGYELALFDMLPIQHGLITENGISNKGKLAEFVKELLKKANVSKGQAVFGLSGQSSVIIKRVSLPLMAESELNLSIKYEAEQHIPLDLDSVAIDFHIIGPKSEDENQMEVWLVAVKKDLLNNYVEVLRMVGLEPAVADVQQFALSNMYEFNYDISKMRNVALVNIGANTTNVNISQEGSPLFLRESDVGSNYQTEMLEKTFGLPREDAERLKKGFPIEGVSQAEAQSIINKASDEIYAEVYRSIEVFRSNVYNEQVSKIILLGGAALIKDFGFLMSQRLDIDVEIADPFRKIIIPDKMNSAYIREMAPIAGIAVGLALRRAGGG
jgi:type IV pilus assembly protein PilM